ncbi:MAG TPA: AraC family transcriptional regulator [Thermoanaerobaculia bacterium]|nr:AraC family transcriptional regulator [Thermoanaerobaculia bacterium]
MNDGDWFFRDKVLLPGEGHSWAAHDHAIVTLVLHGRLDEGLDREVQSCSEFELHYKPRGLPHATSTGPNGVRMFLLGVRDAALEDVEPPEGDRPRVVSGGARAARALMTFLSVAEAGRQRNGPPRHAIRQLWECLKGGRDGELRERPAWITEVRERIESEQGRRSNLTRLASEFRVHPVYLARAFRSHYGHSIGSLRRRLRTDRAITRLRADATSLAGVALELGYSDESHFIRELKRETGWTPGRFRAAASSLGRLE